MELNGNILINLNGVKLLKGWNGIPLIVFLHGIEKQNFIKSDRREVIGKSWNCSPLIVLLYGIE